MQDSFAQGLFRFYRHLHPPAGLPRGIDCLYPQADPAVRRILREFLDKYFCDRRPRRILWGINPGRLGAGITGINFTAPRQLSEICGIDHTLGNGTELSAEFIYQVIKEYGGPGTFYRDWFIGAVCPLGFMQHGKNINYYDDKKLLRAVTPFIREKIKELLSLDFETDYCLCVGGDKNFRFLHQLNEEAGWFQQILPLPHPRFILQYRRKQSGAYLQQYLEALRRPAMS